MSESKLTDYNKFNIWLQDCPVKVKEYVYKPESIVIEFEMKLEGDHE